jgi:hypothetical protein
MIHTPDTLCPVCKKILNAATHTNGEEVSPIPGDISVCFGCATPLVFGEGLTLSKLPDEEYQKLPAPLKREIDGLIIKIKWKDV